MDKKNGNILIYQNEKGDTKVYVYFNDESIWMSQKNIAELYQTSPQNITMHIRNIYKDGELLEEATCKDYLQVQNEGTRQIQRTLKIYNLQMILAIGYRVRNNIGMHFRNWASSILGEYMRKGFAMNDERLKNPKNYGEDYFDELLERIRDIRASEKRVYMKIKDIFATSVDYDPKSEQASIFFKTVQNKLHYSNLNRIVTMYLDYAEDQAKQHIPMYMKNWEEKLNAFLQFTGRNILDNAGNVTKEMADVLAIEQYNIFDENRRKNEKYIFDTLPELPLS